MFTAAKPRVPEGLRDLMKDFTREIFKEKPTDICDFAENYFKSRLQQNGNFIVNKYEEPFGKYDFPHIRYLQHHRMPVGLVYSVIPEGFTNFIKDLIKAVLREQPHNICEFAVEYFRHLKASNNPESKFGAQKISFTALQSCTESKCLFVFKPNVKCKCGRILGGVYAGSVRTGNLDATKINQSADLILSSNSLLTKDTVKMNKDLAYLEKYLNSIHIIQKHFRRFLRRKQSKAQKRFNSTHLTTLLVSPLQMNDNQTAIDASRETSEIENKTRNISSDKGCENPINMKIAEGVEINRDAKPTNLENIPKMYLESKAKQYCTEAIENSIAVERVTENFNHLELFNNTHHNLDTKVSKRDSISNGRKEEGNGVSKLLQVTSTAKLQQNKRDTVENLHDQADSSVRQVLEAQMDKKHNPSITENKSNRGEINEGSKNRDNSKLITGITPKLEEGELRASKQNKMDKRGKSDNTESITKNEETIEEKEFSVLPANKMDEMANKTDNTKPIKKSELNPKEVEDNRLDERRFKSDNTEFCTKSESKLGEVQISVRELNKLTGRTNKSDITISITPTESELERTEVSDSEANKTDERGSKSDNTGIITGNQPKSEEAEASLPQVKKLIEVNSESYDTESVTGTESVSQATEVDKRSNKSGNTGIVTGNQLKFEEAEASLPQVKKLIEGNSESYDTESVTGTESVPQATEVDKRSNKSGNTGIVTGNQIKFEEAEASLPQVKKLIEGSRESYDTKSVTGTESVPQATEVDKRSNKSGNTGIVTGNQLKFEEAEASLPQVKKLIEGSSESYDTKSVTGTESVPQATEVDKRSNKSGNTRIVTGNQLKFEEAEASLPQVKKLIEGNSESYDTESVTGTESVPQATEVDKRSNKSGNTRIVTGNQLKFEEAGSESELEEKKASISQATEVGKRSNKSGNTGIVTGNQLKFEEAEASLPQVKKLIEVNSESYDTESVTGNESVPQATEVDKRSNKSGNTRIVTGSQLKFEEASLPQVKKLIEVNSESYDTESVTGNESVPQATEVDKRSNKSGNTRIVTGNQLKFEEAGSESELEEKKASISQATEVGKRSNKSGNTGIVTRNQLKFEEAEASLPQVKKLIEGNSESYDTESVTGTESVPQATEVDKRSNKSGNTRIVTGNQLKFEEAEASLPQVKKLIEGNSESYDTESVTGTESVPQATEVDKRSNKSGNTGIVTGNQLKFEEAGSESELEEKKASISQATEVGKRSNKSGNTGIVTRNQLKFEEAEASLPQVKKLIEGNSESYDTESVTGTESVPQATEVDKRSNKSGNTGIVTRNQLKFEEAEASLPQVTKLIEVNSESHNTESATGTESVPQATEVDKRSNKSGNTRIVTGNQLKFEEAGSESELEEKKSSISQATEVGKRSNKSGNTGIVTGNQLKFEEAEALLRPVTKLIEVNSESHNTESATGTESVPQATEVDKRSNKSGNTGIVTGNQLKFEEAGSESELEEKKSSISQATEVGKRSNKSGNTGIVTGNQLKFEEAEALLRPVTKLIEVNSESHNTESVTGTESVLQATEVYKRSNKSGNTGIVTGSQLKFEEAEALLPPVTKLIEVNSESYNTASVTATESELEEKKASISQATEVDKRSNKSGNTGVVTGSQLKFEEAEASLPPVTELIEVNSESHNTESVTATESELEEKKASISQATEVDKRSNKSGNTGVVTGSQLKFEEAEALLPPVTKLIEVNSESYNTESVTATESELEEKKASISQATEVDKRSNKSGNTGVVTGSQLKFEEAEALLPPVTKLIEVNSESHNTESVTATESELEEKKAAISQATEVDKRSNKSGNTGIVTGNQLKFEEAEALLRPVTKLIEVNSESHNTESVTGTESVLQATEVYKRSNKSGNTGIVTGSQLKFEEAEASLPQVKKLIEVNSESYDTESVTGTESVPQATEVDERSNKSGNTGIVTGSQLKFEEAEASLPQVKKLIEGNSESYDTESITGTESVPQATEVDKRSNKSGNTGIVTGSQLKFEEAEASLPPVTKLIEGNSESYDTESVTRTESVLQATEMDKRSKKSGNTGIVTGNQLKFEEAEASLPPVTKLIEVKSESHNTESVTGTESVLQATEVDKRSNKSDNTGIVTGNQLKFEEAEASLPPVTKLIEVKSESYDNESVTRTESVSQATEIDKRSNKSGNTGIVTGSQLKFEEAEASLPPVTKLIEVKSESHNTESVTGTEYVLQATEMDKRSNKSDNTGIVTGSQLKFEEAEASLPPVTKLTEVNSESHNTESVTGAESELEEKKAVVSQATEMNARIYNKSDNTGLIVKNESKFGEVEVLIPKVYTLKEIRDGPDNTEFIRESRSKLEETDISVRNMDILLKNYLYNSEPHANSNKKGSGDHRMPDRTNQVLEAEEFGNNNESIKDTKMTEVNIEFLGYNGEKGSLDLLKENFISKSEEDKYDENYNEKLRAENLSNLFQKFFHNNFERKGINDVNTNAILMQVINIISGNVTDKTSIAQTTAFNSLPSNSEANLPIECKNNFEIGDMTGAVNKNGSAHEILSNLATQTNNSKELFVQRQKQEIVSKEKPENIAKTNLYKDVGPVTTFGRSKSLINFKILKDRTDKTTLAAGGDELSPNTDLNAGYTYSDLELKKSSKRQNKISESFINGNVLRATISYAYDDSTKVSSLLSKTTYREDRIKRMNISKEDPEYDDDSKEITLKFLFGKTNEKFNGATLVDNEATQSNEEPLEACNVNSLNFIVIKLEGEGNVDNKHYAAVPKRVIITQNVPKVDIDSNTPTKQIIQDIYYLSDGNEQIKIILDSELFTEIKRLILSDTRVILKLLSSLESANESNAVDKRNNCLNHYTKISQVIKAIYRFPEPAELSKETEKGGKEMSHSGPLKSTSNEWKILSNNNLAEENSYNRNNSKKNVEVADKNKCDNEIKFNVTQVAETTYLGNEVLENKKISESSKDILTQDLNKANIDLSAEYQPYPEDKKVFNKQNSLNGMSTSSSQQFTSDSHAKETISAIHRPNVNNMNEDQLNLMQSTEGVTRNETHNLKLKKSQENHSEL